MSIYKKFAGQTFIYGATTIFSRLLNFILTPFYVLVFPKAIYGIFTNVYANISIVNALLSFGMETTFFRYVNKHEDRKEQVFNNSFWFIFAIATVFLSFGLLFRDFVTQQIVFNDIISPADLAIKRNYVTLFIWISFVDAICVIPFAKLRSEGRPIRYGVIKLLNILVFIGINLFFLWLMPLALKRHWIQEMPSWYHAGWLGYVFIANLVASALTFVMLFPQFKSLSFSANRPVLKQMILYAFPILIANLSFIINENLDKIMMGKLLPDNISNEEIGVYGACAKIAIFLNIFIQAYRLGAEPFFFNHAKNENAPKTYAQLMHFFIIAVTVIFLGIITNIQWLKYFIANHDYWEGLKVVPFLLLGYVCLGIYMNLSVWYRLTDQTKYAVYISIIGALLTIVLNWIFIPKYSYMASAMISFFAYFVMMIASFLWGQKYYPIPYQVKKGALTIGVAIVFAAISFWVFDRNLVIGNGLLFIFVGGIWFLNKETFNKLIKK